ncbi:MAG: aminoacyl-tRNA hydrolase [Desulfobacterales bacterium]|jgi:PTH1 family peptidyl-tRNA hydrolase
MLQKRIRLIAGLGNPGDAYQKTRHNTGFMVIEEVATTFAISLARQKFKTRYGAGSLKGIDVILAKPMSFMNHSGPPVKRLADYFRIKSEDILVIHDDIDLAFGKLKIKDKGGHAGHKGVKSLMEAFGKGDFVRLRIGVGRSTEGIRVSDYVLGKFSSEEKKILAEIIATARDAAVTIICEGVKEGMNRFNSTRILNP